jgi:hypothetical protein
MVTVGCSSANWIPFSIANSNAPSTICCRIIPILSIAGSGGSLGFVGPTFPVTVLLDEIRSELLDEVEDL